MKVTMRKASRSPTPRWPLSTSNPPISTANGTIPSPRGGRMDDVVIRAQALSGDEAEARRRHQALLRACHCDVDAPCVHLELHAAKGGDGIDHQQRLVAGDAARF